MDIYDAIEEGLDIHEIIADMDIDEMMDFFADADPTLYL